MRKGEKVPQVQSSSAKCSQVTTSVGKEKWVLLMSVSPDVDVRLVRADQSKLKSCGNIFPTKEEYKVRVYATTAAEH